ncbi:MAG: hypothetical protein QOG06_910 [Gaiellaceae bacterium]|jgi:hypothetical protein|nr:hypothetical protein [Gaiellaceae bacterium]MDX6506266.1 hypothetical protein [Gaiellaceae bacterium]
MRITRQAVTALRSCAICERSLLVGERAVRYTPDGENFVDVCPLCLDIALEHGWLKEGSPTTPVVAERRRRRRSLSSLFESSRKPTAERVVDEPILRRLSEPELAMVEAAELFNESAFRRTIAGIAKSLGAPKASIVPLSGTNAEVVLTVAWDISWYQYRVTPDSAQPVRLAERGHEPRELEGMFTGWNAKLTEDGRIVPDISPL